MPLKSYLFHNSSKNVQLEEVARQMVEVMVAEGASDVLPPARVGIEEIETLHPALISYVVNCEECNVKKQKQKHAIAAGVRRRCYAPRGAG